MLRTHTCGQLRAEHVGQTVTLCGWVDRNRDLGGVQFIDLRDRYGKTQVVFGPEGGKPLQEFAGTLRSEFVIQVTGKVALRPADTANPKLATGEVELRATELAILNPSLTPPVSPSVQEVPGEDLRLKYRYLDLRREEMQRVLLLRDRIVKGMRDYFAQHQFIDVETPMLGRSTPEGARDYLVPSRVHNGKFYALPQSPQLYKQILMIAGYDRYVQVARCFRDEDLRADRQPEFTQLDVEMSFVDAEDVIGMIDGLMQKLAKELLGIDLKLPLPRMTYDEAMERFGHDAPDLRYGLELKNVTAAITSEPLELFVRIEETREVVRAINVKNGMLDKRLTSNRLKEIEDTSRLFETRWLKPLKISEVNQERTGIAKKISESAYKELCLATDASPNDLLFLCRGSYSATSKNLGNLRRYLADELGLIPPGSMNFSWVVEFPMFAWDEESNAWAAMHHPFTAPRKQDLEKLSTDPGACRAQAYDLVINGYEAGGGTIRIHDQQTQSQVFGLLGLDEATARERFGFLLDALQYGAPPHGGIALGIDRCVMLFGGLTNIRDCIAFPKTQKASDMMTEAPGTVDTKQLRELGVKIAKE